MNKREMMKVFKVMKHMKRRRTGLFDIFIWAVIIFVAIYFFMKITGKI